MNLYSFTSKPVRIFLKIRRAFVPQHEYAALDLRYLVSDGTVVKALCKIRNKTAYNSCFANSVIPLDRRAANWTSATRCPPVFQIKQACQAEGLVFANLQFMFLNIHESFSHRTQQYSGNSDVDFILFVMLLLGRQLFTDPASHTVSET